MTEHMTDRNRWLALVIVCLGYLMIVLDVTIVGVALPSIQDDLVSPESSLAWVANAYLLTFGGFLLLAGRLGDLFGHRRLFLLGIALFTSRRSPAGSLRRRSCSSGRGRCRASAAQSSRRLRCRSSSPSSPSLRSGRRRWGLRFRRRRRRIDRRPTRRDPDRRPQLALDLPRQRADRRRRRRPGEASAPGHASRPPSVGWTSPGRSR